MIRYLVILLMATITLAACSKTDTPSVGQNYVNVPRVNGKTATPYARYSGNQLYISNIDFINQPYYVGPLTFVELYIDALEGEHTYTLYNYDQGPYNPATHFRTASCGIGVYQDEYGDMYSEYMDIDSTVYKGTFLSDPPTSGSITVRQSRSKYRISYDITFPGNIRMTGNYIGAL